MLVASVRPWYMLVMWEGVSEQALKGWAARRVGEGDSQRTLRKTLGNTYEKSRYQLDVRR
jgi:hypothetical protein